MTWSRTERAATHDTRLQTPRRHWQLEKYMMWTVTEWPFGKQRREYIVDPLLFASKKVHWRNYEAGYDVAELEPVSRTERTYVLQEYFVPIDRFDEFVPLMADILQRHRVNAVNVSVRHALADPGSLLAWAREECFAFVLYYKQRTRDTAKARLAYGRANSSMPLYRAAAVTICPIRSIQPPSNSTRRIRVRASYSR